ncbi:MAG TPA: four helix bundle protein, partial [Chitinophagaceae bacterium]|nr:four helix bundle protein [Chitinophagaceae bacterium]
MFLPLNHQQLDIYKITRAFVKDCYLATKIFPVEERFNLIQQIRRAALSVHLNIAEGASGKSEQERKIYYEIARGFIMEIDAALDIASDLEYCKKENLKDLGNNMVRCFSMLSKLIT